MQLPFLYVKIFGERNTGTNIIAQTIRHNFTVGLLRGEGGALFQLGRLMAPSVPSKERRALRTHLHDIEMARIRDSDFGWKHSAPPIDAIAKAAHRDQTLFLVITKHPYFWLRSLHRRPYSFVPPPESISDFLRTEFPISRSDELEGDHAPSPVHMFRSKIAAYRRLSELPVETLFLRYEDFLTDWDGFMGKMADRLWSRDDAFAPVDADPKGSAAKLADYRKKYDLEKVQEQLSGEDRAYVTEILGEENFAFLGYRP
ncbi:MAG: hypothetical protein LC634_05495 [Sphingomonadales bacterium]|nr:hypothetical protein [Sphingomonadales bacterium]